MTTELTDTNATAPDMVEVVLEARRLTKVYGDLRAVDAVSFRIGRGEVVGLVGPNAAGKTTVIRILSTMLVPSAGGFTVLGHDGRDAAAVRGVIGVFPENSTAPGGHSGLAELEYHARLHGYDRAAASSIAEALLDEVGLQVAARRRVNGYSRGMRQRLGIARALIGDPAVVFLDEPTLGLDPAVRRLVLEILLEISRRRGCAVVVSTHLLDEVERVCDRVLILDRGQLVADGTVDDLRERSGLPSLVHLELDGDLEAAERALRELSGVRRVETVSGHLGELQATLDDADGDAAPALIGALMEVQTVRIRRFAFEPARLEDVFLRLTDGER